MQAGGQPGRQTDRQTRPLHGPPPPTITITCAHTHTRGHGHGHTHTHMRTCQDEPQAPQPGQHRRPDQGFGNVLTGPHGFLGHVHCGIISDKDEYPEGQAGKRDHGCSPEAIPVVLEVGLAKDKGGRLEDRGDGQEGDRVGHRTQASTPNPCPCLHTGHTCYLLEAKGIAIIVLIIIVENFVRMRDTLSFIVRPMVNVG